MIVAASVVLLGAVLKRGPGTNGLPEGMVSVLDYGARCDLKVNDGTANVTDDAVAIQRAIDAVHSDNTLHSLYFPRACYTTVKIDWSRTVNLIGTNIGGHTAIGNQLPTGGIWCSGNGMNTNCVETENPFAQDDAHFTQMRNFNIAKAKVCDENPTHPCTGNQAGCTCSASTDTLGSGLVWDQYMGEGTSMDRVWVNNFPEYGIELNAGVQGHGHMSMISLWGNGQAAPISADVDSGTNSTLTATGDFTGLTLDDWYITITADVGGGAAGLVRRIKDNTDDVITLDGTWAGGRNPADGDTYSIDHGGGILIDNDSVVAGCLIQSISGDSNAPALIHIVEGSGGEHSGSGPACVIQNVKAEGGGETLAQENAIRFTNSGMRVVVQGVRHTDKAPWGNALLYFEGKGCPREVEYSGLGDTTQARSDYELIDTSGVDLAACQITLLGHSGGGSITHRGTIPNNMEFEPLNHDPFFRFRLIPCDTN